MGAYPDVRARFERAFEARREAAESLIVAHRRGEDAPAEVAALAERRSQARAARDFETSDRLRHELASLGWQMRDEPGGGYTLVRT